MPDAKAQLLGRILDALYAAEFCLPGDKAQRESDYLQLLEETSRWSGKSASLIKEAILRHPRGASKCRSHASNSCRCHRRRAPRLRSDLSRD